MTKILSLKEKSILSALYRLGDASVQDIAKETLINRTTLYPILNKLLQKGLISKISIEGKNLYRVIGADDFKKWLERQKKKTEKKFSQLNHWLALTEKKKKPILLSDFRYFEGKEGVKNLYADTWRNNEGKIIYAITDYHAAYKTMGNFFRQEYFPARINHNVKVKNIIPESYEGRRDLKLAKKLLRQVKFIKLFENLEIELNIYDDKVAIVAFDKKLPSGVLIKNEKIATALKNIFEYIWKFSK